MSAIPVLKQGDQACAARSSLITEADLPLSCPPTDKRVWDAHPRVYLPIEEIGEVACPYCGAHYILKDFTPPQKPLIEH